MTPPSVNPLVVVYVLVVAFILIGIAEIYTQHVCPMCGGRREHSKSCPWRQ